VNLENRGLYAFDNRRERVILDWADIGDAEREKRGETSLLHPNRIRR